ncbi:RNA 2',3'-cyclic phosphodiesterase [Bacillus sp. FJAT-50079]|uniref:RNA 2',3'-cyclic phosphodiesterase n=1 Tax=Bacillus sp. FJAT-50079 TaxID=2833577 RepID=UPI001BC8E7F8|nr:RNA 2',3'-cyclic phosphodiesterase [Bacillus sp. FJAT-50079]MBS4208627.1 RNA 2',3'-cyclic phosphodiesterase [Bacillus sp. FJAT-50079]
MSHYFFAIKLPLEVKDELANKQERLKATAPFKSWVHPEDLHITLTFLGHATDIKIREAIERTDDALKGAKTFRLEVNHIGTFGLSKSPRILWAGMEDSNPLNHLQKHVFTACEAAKFQLDQRPYRPHITLGRKWTGTDEFEIDVLPHFDQPLIFNVTEVVLYQTFPERTPKYKVIESFSLLS